MYAMVLGLAFETAMPGSAIHKEGIPLVDPTALPALDERPSSPPKPPRRWNPEAAAAHRDIPVRIGGGNNWWAPRPTRR